MDMKFKLLEEWEYFKYRFKYRYGKNLKLSSPVDVSLELASQCNMSCEYCYHSDPEKLPFKKGLMSYDIGAKIIREAAVLGVPAIKFNWKGESTINPEFFALTDLAKRLATRSTFIDRLTNSNFKFRHDKEDIFEGLCNQTKVKVSYDSFDERVFEKQRRGGDHSLTTKNIDKFYNYPKRKNTELVIQAVRTKLNAHEDIEGLAKKRWPYANVSIRDMVTGRVDKNLDDLENRSRDLNNRQSCLQAHVRLIFNHKGIALPCCPDISEKLSLGTIEHQSVEQIFNGARAKMLREKLKNKSAFKTFESCMKCPSFESYKGFKPVWNS